jgi:hypothetical protein
MNTKPTPEMTAALQAFADRNGRNWKGKLSDAWANGRDEREAGAAELRNVRNQFGPTWLYDTCKIKPAPGARKGGR